MKTAIELIQTERERQVSAEGYTTAHDDTHAKGELAFCAAAYSYRAGEQSRYPGLNHDSPIAGWPFPDGWKPSGRIRNLVKAAALIVAEIERLQRAGAQAS
ncbi:MAG: hypothetical protein IAE97_00300 [Chthoniobacterales bacterium]|nr:hypothetical protein [Chthoniobacterales bacterium]